ncbi:MAG: hypothetical protein WDN30_15070 [Pararobbsia sp.]
MLEARFPSVEVVEGSADCIAAAAAKTTEAVKFNHARFESFEPARRYDNIF